MEKNNIVKWAKRYAQRGWSIIPQKQDKSGYMGWALFQKRQATEEEIVGWWGQWPTANIAVVTGAISGIVILDIDSDEAGAFVKEHGMPPTPQVKTKRGTHHYFKHPGTDVPGSAGLGGIKGLDISGDRSLATLPRSIHETGVKYSWAQGLNPKDVELADLPPWLLKLINENGGGKRNPPGWEKEAPKGKRIGERGVTASKLSGGYVTRGF